MRWVSIPVGIVGSGGHTVDGEVAECDECGNEFRLHFLFRMNGQLHAQCNYCDQVHCLHKGQCKGVETWGLDAFADTPGERPVAYQPKDGD